MTEKIGVKELTEALVACVKVGKVVIKHVADGVQPTDALAIAKDLIIEEEVRTSVLKAVEGSTEIPAEIKDLSIEEALEIIQALMLEISK